MAVLSGRALAEEFSAEETPTPLLAPTVAGASALPLLDAVGLMKLKDAPVDFRAGGALGLVVEFWRAREDFVGALANLLVTDEAVVESFLTSPPWLGAGADLLDVADSCVPGTWMDPSELFLLRDWLLARVLWLSLLVKVLLLG